MKPEKPEQNSEQISDQQPIPPRFLKLFLTFNLIALAGFFIWELGGSAGKSKEEALREKERNAAYIEKALESNPQTLSGSDGRVNVERYAIDATNSDLWIHFSFSKGITHRNESLARDSFDWDIAFRRAKIVSNGGATNPEGKVAVAALEGADFQSIDTVPPEEAFDVDIIKDNPAEPKNPAIDKWYKYDFWTHQLKPGNTTFVIRTADGGYAKLRILDYYCGSASACYTIRYAYLGTDSNSFDDK